MKRVTRSEFEKMLKLFDEGYSYAEISRQIGIKASTVSYNIRKSKKYKEIFDSRKESSIEEKVLSLAAEIEAVMKENDELKRKNMDLVKKMKEISDFFGRFYQEKNT